MKKQTHFLSLATLQDILDIPQKSRRRSGRHVGSRAFRPRVEALEARLCLSGSWTTAASLPLPRSAPAAAVVGNMLYVIGGSNGHETATLQAYNTGTSTWATDLASMPAGRYSGDGAAVINGKIYVPGGWDNSYSYLPHNSLYIYDPASNTWSSGANLPYLSASGVTVAINDKLYVTTPANGYSGTRNFLAVYDPTTNNWTQLTGSPYAQSNPAGGEIDGKLYVAGGSNDSGILNVLDVYDPAANTWTTEAPMPIADANAAASVIAGKLYVVGGWNGASYVNTVQVYDPATNTWAIDAAMPTARSGLAAAVVDGTLYAVGGSNASSNQLGTNEAFSTFVPSNGNLDTTFNGTGIVTTSFDTAGDGANAVALQPDGKIVVAGYANNSQEFALARYSADGSLDTSFGGIGMVTTAFPGFPTATAFSVVVQPDGKIVAAGYVSVGGGSDFALARFNPDGTLDTHFGGGTGEVVTSFGQTADATGVAIAPGGQIVAVGTAGPWYNCVVAVARYNADGTLDNTFNGTGELTAGFSTGEGQGRAVLVQPDGKIVIAGVTNHWGGWVNCGFGLMRFNQDGSLDTTFGGGSGMVATTFGGNGENDANGLALQANGKIVVAGTTGWWPTYEIAVARYNADGTLDTTFNGTGTETTTFAGAQEVYGSSVAVQPDGGIVVVANGPSYLPVVRYNVDGSLDSSFGIGGQVETQFDPSAFSSVSANSVAIEPDGDIVAAGCAYSYTKNNACDFAIVRYAHETSATPVTVGIQPANATYTGAAYATSNITTTLSPGGAAGMISYSFFADSAGNDPIADPTNVGTYYVAAQFASNDTNQWTNAVGTITPFTIGQATASIQVNGYSVTCNGAPHTASFTATGIGGADLSADMNLTGTTHTGVGLYNSDSWSFHDPAGNYTDASGNVNDAIAEAPSLIVTTTADVTNPYDGLTSLREAIAYANSLPGDSTVTFDPSLNGATIMLTEGQLELTARQGTTTIDGGGQITVSGNNSAYSDFCIHSGANAALAGLTIENALYEGVWANADANGGGALKVTNCTIFGNRDGIEVRENYGMSFTTTVTNSTISRNSNAGILNERGYYGGQGDVLTVIDSTISGNSGVGISNWGGTYWRSTGATLTLINSTISGNSGNGIDNDGGYGNAPGAALTVANSTIFGNSGVGIRNWGGRAWAGGGTATVINSTIAGNSGGGIEDDAAEYGSGPGTASLLNTIVAGNGLANSPSDLSGNGFNAAYSLIQEVNGFTCIEPTPWSNRIGVDPLLGPLANNGGPTETMALLSGSPAIDAGSKALAVDADGNPLTTDQRGAGFLRAVGGQVDIGAFEDQPVPVEISIQASIATYTGSPYLQSNVTTTLTPSDAGGNGKVTYSFFADAAGMTPIADPTNAGIYYVEARFAPNDTNQWTNAVSTIVPITIDQAAATVIYSGYTCGTYNGAAHTQTVTVTGVGNDGQLYTTDLTRTNASSYSLPWTFNSNANYLPVSGTLAFKIAKASLTVTADDKIKIYGGTDPALAYTVTGLVGTDTKAVVSGVVLSTTTGTAATVGTHTIYVSGGSAANYSITDVNGTLSVIVDPSLGILLLASTGKGALTVMGNGGVAVAGGGEIVVDSNSTQAATLTGKGSVSAAEIDTKGVSMSGKGTVQGTVDTADAPLVDPWASLPVPSIPSIVQSSKTLIISGNGQVTLQPGLYVGGIKISSNAKVTLAKGIYYLQGGGFSVSGQATVNGADVMLYNAPATSGDTISFTGQGAINLSGLEGGVYQGIAIFQDRNSTAAMSLTGQGNLNINGSIYAAAAALNITGNGGLIMTGNAQKRLADHLIVADMNVTGNGGVSVDVSNNAIPANLVDYYFANY